MSRRVVAMGHRLDPAGKPKVKLFPIIFSDDDVYEKPSLWNSFVRLALRGFEL